MDKEAKATYEFLFDLLEENLFYRDHRYILIAKRVMVPKSFWEGPRGQWLGAWQLVKKCYVRTACQESKYRPSLSGTVSETLLPHR